MSSTRPFEATILASAETVIATALADIPLNTRYEARLQLLEATASLCGGFNYKWYCNLTTKGTFCPLFPTDKWSKKLQASLSELGIHYALALSALARPELALGEQRTGGVYYTDCRLAQYLAAPLKGRVSENLRVLDPASGTGILLVAAALALSEGNKKHFASLIANYLYAADLSAHALRGTALALSSLTDNHASIKRLLCHLRQEDSLVQIGFLWKDIAPGGFDVIIGNPPWEKLKVSRHELLTAQGDERHYGAEYQTDFPDELLTNARRNIAEYTTYLDAMYDRQGKGERDLYKLFTELAIKLTRPGGRILLLVPAGLIRSMGTQRLREYLLDSCDDVEFTIFENRARFFAIDSRFKFLALSAQAADEKPWKPVGIITATGEPDRVITGEKVNISRTMLKKVRPDLSIPEVRSEMEWKVFQDMTLNGQRFGDAEGVWRPVIMREVDMTNDRKYFLKTEEARSVPVIEGRMIHQFRHAVKHYVSGTGRAANWRPVPAGSRCEIRPQFWMSTYCLSDAIKERANVSRVGFCDITGQTNERTMLAARIPAGTVCGNKVPTVLFDTPHEQQHIADYWLAIVNSFPFAWMLRRVVTTTVNFFLLLDLPLPKANPQSQNALRLAHLSRTLSACCHNQVAENFQNHDPWTEAEYRAEIDWRVLQAYGQGLATLQLMMKDFPLLDRSQPALYGEKNSTITRDFLLLRTAEATGEGTPEQTAFLRQRVEDARNLGATPYVPAYLDTDLPL